MLADLRRGLRIPAPLPAARCPLPAARGSGARQFSAAAHWRRRRRGPSGSGDREPCRGARLGGVGVPARTCSPSSAWTGSGPAWPGVPWTAPQRWSPPSSVPMITLPPDGTPRPVRMSQSRII